MRIGAEGGVDASGVVISAELLWRLLAAAPREDDRPAFTSAHFERATFQGGVRFADVIFQGEARFDRARFQGEVRFGRARFQREAAFAGARFRGEAGFGGARFQGEAGFDEARFKRGAAFAGASFKSQAVFAGATFQGDAMFTGASFQRGAVFTGARFQGEASFGRARFQRDAGFAGATFQGDAMFTGAIIEGEAGFGGARFQGEAWFGGVRFQSEARFDGASFERATQIGPLLARQLVVDSAVFGERVQLEVTAAAVSARRTQFPAGVHLRLRFASMVLDDANLAAPAILAGAPSPFPMLAQQEQQVASGWELPPGPREQQWRPRLLSVCRADVAGLRLADVDLRACRFIGVHNLDRLRIEGAPLFASTTGLWRARRKTLAEEQHWRAHRPGRWRRAGGHSRAYQPPAPPKTEAPHVPDPARLAALYRDLRKGREDAKDEPGAADFYYGECEMRRHDPDTPSAEGLVLWAYWLLSGYALRAWRAMAALAVVVVLAGVMFAFWGFPSAVPSFRAAAVDRGGALVYQQQPADPTPGIGQLPDAIRFSARSATALLRGPDRPLTPLGEWLDIGLRFVGPVLLGLAVLSVRGRVRR
jgi:uncharacterized protein YjbI with pentapeptide repeats